MVYQVKAVKPSESVNLTTSTSFLLFSALNDLDRS